MTHQVVRFRDEFFALEPADRDKRGSAVGDVALQGRRGHEGRALLAVELLVGYRQVGLIQRDARRTFVRYRTYEERNSSFNCV